MPELTSGRRGLRRISKWFIQGIVRLFIHLSVQGLENIPRQGPLLMVSNHLGDADAFIGIAVSPVQVEMIAKIELYDIPFLGKLMDAYGVIWIHRGQPDRHALQAALQGLKAGRVIAIAPEGRESLTGSLEEGTSGAAYLGLKSGAPILPVTFTGTENRTIFHNLKNLKRSPVTVTIGKVFSLDMQFERKESLQKATDQIMFILASQLPVQYQGVYSEEKKALDEDQIQ
ncbi:MAG TPA: lysophospholipid acyltransferase family protein [Anaerolineales bacterium]|nr:lysophospholipid acyltransferase family protein [Anaerolineales bacterium]